MTTSRTYAPDPASSSLAVRYRPRRFSEVVGQRHVTTILAKAIATGRVPQQILFSGSSGLGKTTLARVTAAAMLCESPVQEPSFDACGVCAACEAITSPRATHPDVIEFDAASHGGKDDIQVIAERAQLSPLLAKRKIYIIDEAHGLSGPGGQAFLKLLEEPPAHVTFMLATTDPQKMLKTNRGRCTEFEMQTPTPAQMRANLQRVADSEGWNLADAIADTVIAASDPQLGVRATLMSLEKLAGALDDGNALSPQEAAAMLGVSSPADLENLFAAIAANDLAGSLSALRQACASSSSSQVRHALTLWAKEALLDAHDASRHEAIFRLGVLIDTPDIPGALELIVARLVSGEPTLEALQAATERAAKVLGELITMSRQTPPTEITPSTPDAPDPADEVPTKEFDLEEFFSLLAANSPRAVALLRESKVTVQDGLMTMVAPPANIDALRQAAPKIKQAASHFSVTSFRLAVS